MLPVALVEGPLDLIAVRLAGMAGLALLGSGYPEPLEEVLPGRMIIDALDADQGGERIRRQLTPLLKQARAIYRLSLPEGMDPADLARERGAMALWEVMGSF